MVGFRLFCCERPLYHEGESLCCAARCFNAVVIICCARTTHGERSPQIWDPRAHKRRMRRSEAIFGNTHSPELVYLEEMFVLCGTNFRDGRGHVNFDGGLILSHSCRSATIGSMREARQAGM